MDKPLQNDLKKCELQQQPSENLSSDSYNSSSVHDAEEDAVCTTEKVVKELVPVDGGITHQSGSPQSNCESPVGICQSIEEVRCSDSCDQPVPELHMIIPQSSLSESIQQEAVTVDVSPSEGIAIAPKLVSQASSESSHDTVLLNGSVKCFDGSCKNGCQDMSPDHDLKELDNVLCATRQSDPIDSSEVHDSCMSVESPGSVDGRERFSENSDLSQEINEESISTSDGTQLLCDKGDQTCTSSTSVDSGIQSKLTDVETIVKQCSDESSKIVNVCTLADGTSCCITDQPCQHLLIRTLAASVVDEILEGAAKRLLKLGTQVKVGDATKSSSDSEDIQEQVSGCTDGLRQDVPRGDGDVSDSQDIVSYQMISPVSDSDNVIEFSQLTDDKFDSHADSCGDGPSVICNENIATSSLSIQLNDPSPLPNPSVLESSPNVSGSNNDVTDELLVQADDLNSEAKGMSGDDSLESSKDFGASVEKIQLSAQEILCQNLGDKSETVLVSGDVWDKVDVSLGEKDLNFDAKIKSSKDRCGEDADSQSFPAENGACLKDGSPDLADNSLNDIATSISTPVSCASLNESGVLNLNKQEPDLEVVIKLDDLNASSSCSVDNNSELKSVQPKLIPKEAISTDYVPEISSLSDEIGCDLEISAANDKDSTQPKPVDFNNSSFQENTGQHENTCAEQDVAVQEGNIVSDDNCSVLSLEKVDKDSPSHKEENLVQKVTAPAESAPVSPQEENRIKSSSFKEENVGEELIPSTGSAPLSPQKESGKVSVSVQEENLVEEVIFSSDCAGVSLEEKIGETSKIGQEENSAEEMILVSEGANVSHENNTEETLKTAKEENLVEEVISSTESADVSPVELTEEIPKTGQDENLEEELIPSTKNASVLSEETTEVPMSTQEENLVQEVPSTETALVSPQEEPAKVSITSEEENLDEKKETLKECILEKEEKIVVEKITPLENSPVSPQEETGKLEHIGEEECSVEEAIPASDSSASDSSHDNVEYSKLLVCAEEPKSGEVSLKDDISASIPLLGSPEEFAEEEHNSAVSLSGSTNTKQEPKEASITSNHSGEDDPVPLSALPFIVPTVNICPPIIEETYDGITDDESEISHATSDSESDSNVKMVKPVCDGMNTINYKPLLEDDSNDRSTLSLISELDETSMKEELEDEAVSLIMEINKMERDESELVQRTKSQRISQRKTEEASPKEEKPLQDAGLTAKIGDIKEALKSGSLERLKELARSEGGLVYDEFRREAWPRLLGFEPSSCNPLPAISKEDLRKHHEFNQVVLDVNRSLRRFPSKISPEERANLQDQLTEIILRVLMKRKDLSYYQGYHDVAVTTLLVAGKDAAFHILERISIAHLSDCMLPTMERTMYLLNYIYPLIQRINPHLAERMDRVEVGTIFCLPWFLTWYGYSLNRYEDVVRVFDYFLASDQLAPLYLAAVVVGRRSAEVLAADCDHATVHSMLSRIPETLPLEDLLREATELYRNYPPDDIEREVHERVERIRKAQEEEEEQRKRIRQRRMIQRRHSMPTIAARQMPGWFILDRFLGLPMIQGRRVIQLSATVMFGMIAWHLRSEMYRYF